MLSHECNYNVKEILTNWPHSLPRDMYSSSVAISSEQSDRGANSIGSSRIFVSSNYRANFVVITDDNSSNESNNNNDENATNASSKSFPPKKVHKSGGGAPDSPPKRRQLPVMALFELRT